MHVCYLEWNDDINITHQKAHYTQEEYVDIIHGWPKLEKRWNNIIFKCVLDERLLLIWIENDFRSLYWVKKKKVRFTGIWKRS